MLLRGGESWLFGQQFLLFKEGVGTPHRGIFFRPSETALTVFPLHISCDETKPINYRHPTIILRLLQRAFTSSNFSPTSYPHKRLYHRLPSDIRKRTLQYSTVLKLGLVPRGRRNVCRTNTEYSHFIMPTSMCDARTNLWLAWGTLQCFGILSTDCMLLNFSDIIFGPAILLSILRGFVAALIARAVAKEIAAWIYP